MVGDYFSKMAAAQKETPMQQKQSVQNGILTPNMAADAALSQPKPAPQPAQPQVPIAQQIMQDASQVGALDPATIQEQIAQLKLEIPQIRNEIQTEKLKPYEGIPLLKEKVITLQKLEAQLATQLQQPVGINALPTQQSGVAALPSGIDEESYAGGGIVAFAKGGQSFDEKLRELQYGPEDDDAEIQTSALFRQGALRDKLRGLPSIGNFRQNLAGYMPTRTQDADAQPGGFYGGAAPRQVVPVPVAPTAPIARIAPAAVRPPVTPDSQYIAQDQQEGYASTPVSGQAAPVVQQDMSPAASAYEKVLQESKQSAAEDLDRSKWLRVMEAGFGMLGGTSPYFGANVGQGVMPAIKGYAADVAANRKDEAERIRLMLTLGMKKEEMAQALGLKTRELDQELKKLGITEELYKHHGNYYDAMAKAAGVRAAGVGSGAGTRLTIAQMNNARGIFTTLQKSATDMTSPNYGKPTEELWATAQAMASGQTPTGLATNTVEWSSLGKK
jgi:hypothetical protein